MKTMFKLCPHSLPQPASCVKSHCYKKIKLPRSSRGSLVCEYVAKLPKKIEKRSAYTPFNSSYSLVIMNSGFMWKLL